ncbi:MAG: hypothetical protein ACO1O4_01220 [Devosia sp.]
MPDRQEHWEHVYGTKLDHQTSWFEEAPSLSLEIIRRYAQGARSAIDIGAGTSRLVDRLLGFNYEHVSVLDLSATALQRARERLGADRRIGWIVAERLPTS